MTTGSRVLLALAVVGLGGVSGFIAARLLGHSTRATVAVAPRAPVTAGGQSGGSAPEQVSAASHPIPETLPRITLADAEGKKHSLSEWQGRPLVINFWATWCEPCRREIPLLKKLRQERRADGVELVGIAVDFRDAVQSYAKQMAIDYPVLVGEQDGLEAIAAFGMQTLFPFTVFADRQGRIVTLKVGELHADEARFILDRVRDVDQGRLALAAARKAISDENATLAAQRARAVQALAESSR